MNLFQKSVLAKYLSRLNETVVDSSWDVFRAHFHDPVIQQNIRNSKEEQYQGEFLIDLFVKVFGYTKNPQPNFNLTTELKNVKNAKKTDGAILKNGAATAVIELKGMDTTDLSKVENQAFGYKNNQPGCTYVITSNFNRLRFYIDNAVEFLEFDLFTLTRDDFSILYLCLNAEQLLADVPKTIKGESLTEEENISKKLYKDYSLFRRELFNSLVESNQEHDKLTLFKKTQKLLDRFLFIFFAEDRNLLPPNSIGSILKQWRELKEQYDVHQPLYDRFKKYFGYLNTGHKGEKHDIFAYNGGLFLPDPLLDTIAIDDELLERHTARLTQYDFESEVSVNILGHIFEHSLNEIEELQSEIAGDVIEKKKTKRKKDGVFYTPKYITKYIVDNTVGKLCEAKKTELGIEEEEYAKDRKGRKKATLKKLTQTLDDYRSWLLTLTICDPACGSGAFLNQALEFLIAEHHYIDELKAKLLGDAMVFSEVQNAILENNLFGVDINEESVEIAKLSLWLRTAQKGRKLTSLNNNIKCGNSLIDDPEVAGDKAFDWHQEFSNVFKSGGFDVIIGNPPYVQSHGLDERSKNFIYSEYSSAEYQINTYAIFMERILKLLSVESVYSVIIPNYWLSTKNDSRLRALLFLNNHCIEVLNVFSVFEDATVDTVIVSGRRMKTSNFPQSTKVKAISQKLKSIPDRLSAIADKNWATSKIVNFHSLGDSTLISFEEKLDLKGSKVVGDFFHGFQGMKPYERGKGQPHQTREMMKAKIYHSEHKVDETYQPLVGAGNVQRYSLRQPKVFIKYGVHLAAPRKIDIFKGPRLLVNRILSKERLDVVYEDKIIINNTDVFNLIPKCMEVEFVKSLLAILATGTCSTYFRKSNVNLNRAAFPKLNVNNLLAYPLPELNDIDVSELSKKADLMMIEYAKLKSIEQSLVQLLKSKFDLSKLSRKLLAWHGLNFGDFLKELGKKKIKLSLSEEAEWMKYFSEQKEKVLKVKTEISGTEREIDQMVYELYGLTEDEIQLVESSSL